VTELGFGLSADTQAAIVEQCAREAERLGYGSFWLNHPGRTDGVAGLVVAASATERIELGVGVVPLTVRPAEDVADGVRAAGLPLERLLLGIGSPNPQALARMRAGVGALRAELSCRIIAAALGPRMCRLAGELADGVLFNWLTPEHARRSGDLVREGAAAAGREAPKLYAYVRLALGPDGRDRVEREWSNYARNAMYAAHSERMEGGVLRTAVTDDVAAQLAEWEGAVDSVVLRALPGGDSLEEHLELVRAAR
jgi:alkanesulfonate monooxygenase SsuD/methylene tetrahydromethanopterin reductase-like flavin-dependent oxidoreductase (luciferase family)